MDPVTVISLVAACSSLAARCGSAVKTLHSLVEAYKHIEIYILSMAEECETIEFAWRRIEAWATQNLQYLDNFDHLRDRLQKSIYTCQFVVSALQDDLAKISADCKSKRQASMIWNEGVFQDHRTRVRGQVACLQLLLQVMNMPSYEDRIEALSVKEHVFQEADESVLSIVPSRMSTCFSVTDSHRASIQRVVSTKLRYIGKSFENELFTSNVYKRNYRLPHMQQMTPMLRSLDEQPNPRKSRIRRSSPSITAIQEISEENAAPSNKGSDHTGCLPEHRTELRKTDKRLSQYSGISQITIIHAQARSTVENTTMTTKARPVQPKTFPETVLETVPEAPSTPFQLEELLKLQFRDGVDIPQRSGRNEVLERRLLMYLKEDKQLDAAKLLLADLDIAILFDERSAVSSNVLFRLLHFMSRDTPEFFITAIQRMAFVAGLAWVTRLEFAWTSRFQAYFCPGEDSAAPSCSSGRSKIERAAGFFERTMQAALETSSERPTVFQLACAAQSYEVTSYLLRVGLGPNSGPAYAHPIIQAIRRNDCDLEKILRNRLHIPKDIYTRALWSLFTPHVAHRILWYSDIGNSQYSNRYPSLLPASQAAKIFIKSGADTVSLVDYGGEKLPFIHAVMYALHDADISCNHRLEMFTVVVQGGTKVDAVGKARGGNTNISALSLAAALGEVEMLKVLLDHGAKLFWPRYSTVFHGVSANADSSGFEGIVRLLSSHDLLWPDKRARGGPRTSNEAYAPNLSASDSVFATLRIQYALGVSISTTQSRKRSATEDTHPMLERNSDCAICSPSNNSTDKCLGHFKRGSPELVFEFHSALRFTDNDQHSREMIDFIQRRKFDHAVQSLLDGADIGTAFLPELGGPLDNILDFLWHLWRSHMYLFFLALQRLAFVAGASWTLELRDAFLRYSSTYVAHNSPKSRPNTVHRKRKESCLDCAWRLIIRSGIFTSNRRRAEKSSTIRPALYYACAAKDESAVMYLLHIGQRTTSLEDTVFALSRSTPVTRQLLKESAFAPSAVSSAMELVFSENFLPYGSLMSPYSLDRLPSERSEAIVLMENLLSHGADASLSIIHGKKLSPLLHCAIYTDEPLRLKMIECILDNGANPDTISIVPWHESSSTTRISALALAALMPLPDVMDLLVRRGVSWIWSDDLDLQRLAEKNFCRFFEEAVASLRANSYYA